MSVRATACSTSEARPDAPPARAWLLLLVLAAGGLVYANSLGGAFLFDDYQHIVINPAIRELSRLDVIVRSSSRPVVSLTLALNYALGQLNPVGYHIFNIAVHLAAAAVLFGLVRRTLLLEACRDRLGAAAGWLPTAVALLWVVHPLQTQSITYLIQRGESLTGLFYLLTLYAVVRGATARHAVGWYGLAVAACAAGMATKAVIVTAPVMVLLYDWTFLARSVRGALRSRWVLYFGLAATWVVLFTLGEGRDVYRPPADAPPTVGFAFKDVTPLEYLQTQPGVILHYARLALVPYPQCLDYAWPVARGLWEIALPSIVVGAALLATLWGLARRSWAGFVGAWFFLILAPTSSFVPVRDLAFEHRMYLSLAAVLILVAVGGHAIVRWVAARGAVGSAAARHFQVILLVLAVAVLGGLTVARNRVYSSEISMWEDVVAQRPQNGRAWNGLGVALSQSGRVDESVVALRRATEADPNLAAAEQNLGKSLARLGRYAEAIPHYQAGLVPGSVTGAVYNSLGWAYEKTGDMNSAYGAYQRAVELAPDCVECRCNFATVLLAQRQVGAAIRELQSAIELRPNDVQIRLRLATLLADAGRLDEAVCEYRTALTAQPTLAEAHYMLGNVLLQQRRWPEALDEYTTAVAQNPRLADARCNRGITLLELQRRPEAMSEFQTVLAADSRHVIARYNLAKALAAEGRTREAVAELQKVLEIDPGHEPSRQALQGLTKR